MKTRKILKRFLDSTKLKQPEIVEKMSQYGPDFGVNNLSQWSRLDSSMAPMSLLKAKQMHQAFPEFPLVDYFMALLKDAKAYPNLKALSQYTVAADIIFALMEGYEEELSAYESAIEVIKSVEEIHQSKFPIRLTESDRDLLNGVIHNIMDNERKAVEC